MASRSTIPIALLMAQKDKSHSWDISFHAEIQIILSSPQFIEEIFIWAGVWRQSFHETCQKKFHLLPS